MATAEVSGTALHYTEVGEGPVCFVLHGGLGYDQTAYRTLDPRSHSRTGSPGASPTPRW